MFFFGYLHTSHAESPNHLSEKNNDKEENNKTNYLQKESNFSKRNKSSYNSKSRSSSGKDSHRSSSSRSKTEKHRHHHHRSKESTHTIDSSSPHKESYSSRKHSKRHRRYSSHNQIEMKNPCFKNKCESINDNSAVKSSPMLVWSDDHDESPIKDLSQKEKNTDNQDQVIFLHCEDISDDEDLIGEALDSHECKKQTDDYCKTNNEKTEEKVIEEEKKSNNNEKEINPVEPSVSEASLSSTVHDKNEISKKSQDSETCKILKPKEIYMASFEHSDKRTIAVLLSSKHENPVDIDIETEPTVIPLEKELIPEDSVPIGIQTTNIAQYISSFKVNDSPPNVDPKSGKLEKRKSSTNDEKGGLEINHTIKNSYASAAFQESQLEFDSNLISKNCDLDANATLSDKRSDVDTQSGRSENDYLIVNVKKIENEENDEKIETETVALSKYKEQETSFIKNPHSEKNVDDSIACESYNYIKEKMALNENTQQLIPVELEEQRKHKRDGKAELLHTMNSLHPLNQHVEVDKNKSLSINEHLAAEENNDSFGRLNSKMEIDEKVELLRLSQPSSFHTEVSANENLSTSERSTAEEDVQFALTKGYKVEEFLTAKGSGESPQKITYYEKTVSERKPVQVLEQNILSEGLFAYVPIIKESIQPIEDGQLSLAAKIECDAFDSINDDKERNEENELLNSMHSCHPSNFHNEIVNNQNLLTNELSIAEKVVSFVSSYGNVGSPGEISNNTKNVFEGKLDTLSENEPVKSIYDGQLSTHATITHEVHCQSLSKPNYTPNNEQILSPNKDKTETKILAGQITNPACSTNELISIPTMDQIVSNSTTELNTIRTLSSIVSPQKISNSRDGSESSHSHSDSVSSGRRKKIKTPQKRTEEISNTTTAIDSGRYTYPSDESRSVLTPIKYDMTSSAVLSKTVSEHRDAGEENIAGLSIWKKPDSEEINPINTPRLETKTYEETPDENKSETNGSLSKISHASDAIGKEISIGEISQENEIPKDDNEPETIATNLVNETSKQKRENGTCTLLVAKPSKNAEEIQAISSEKALPLNSIKNSLQTDQHYINLKNDKCYENNSSPETKAKNKGYEENDLRNSSHIESEIKQHEKLDVRLVPEENKIEKSEANESLTSSRLGEVKIKEETHFETNTESFSITIKRKRTDNKSINEKNNEIKNHNCEKNSTSSANDQSCKNSTSPLNANIEALNNSASASKNSKRYCQQKPVIQHQMMKHFMDSDHTLVGTCNYQSMSCPDEGAIEKPTETNAKKKKSKNETLTYASDFKDFKDATTGSASKTNARVAPNLEENKTFSKRKYKRKTTQNLDSSNSNDDIKKATTNNEDPLKILSVDYDNNPQKSKVLKNLEGSELKEPIKKWKHRKQNSNIFPDNNSSPNDTEINLTTKIMSLEKYSSLSHLESFALHSSHETARSVDEILDRLHSQNETTDLRLKECLKKLSKEFLESSEKFPGKTLEESSPGIPQFPSDENVDVIESSSYGEKEQNLVSIKRSKEARRQKKRKLSASLDAKTEEAILQPKRSKKLSQDCSLSPINTCDTRSCHALEKHQCKSLKEHQRSPSHEKNITTAITPTHHKIFLNDVFPENPPPFYSANDDDIQYQELDNRMRSLFGSPSYTQSVNGESSFDQRNDGRGQASEDSLTVAETLNQSERSECDKSTSSKKVSLGPNEYVIESVGTHTANVFITRKRCKKRTKFAGSGV